MLIYWLIPVKVVMTMDAFSLSGTVNDINSKFCTHINVLKCQKCRFFKLYDGGCTAILGNRQSKSVSLGRLAMWTNFRVWTFTKLSYSQQEIRSVEHSICPIAEFTSPWLNCAHSNRIPYPIFCWCRDVHVLLRNIKWIPKSLGWSNRCRDIVIFKLLGGRPPIGFVEV